MGLNLYGLLPKWCLQRLYIRGISMATQIRYGDIAMMGHQEGFQPKLFYHQINLDQRVPPNHPLRKIQEKIDFDFVYGEVKDTYGDNGNVSIPPPVILKMMLLLVLYNVRSERELMETIPMRLDWLWFLGYDLDSEVPNQCWRRWGRKRKRLNGPSPTTSQWSGRTIEEDAKEPTLRWRERPVCWHVGPKVIGRIRESAQVLFRLLR